jgi:phosphoglycerate dehydrogenase-like enzyme
MSQEITILSYYDMDPQTINRLRTIWPTLQVHRTQSIEDMADWIADADIVLHGRFTDELLYRAHKLRWYQSISAGVERLLTPDFIESDVVLTNASGNHAISVSEHAFALLLAVTRRIIDSYGEDNLLDRWDRETCVELYGKTMGVLGMGNVGREIARKAAAFGMRVRGYDSRPAFVPYLDEMYLSDQIEEFFSDLDVLVVAAALTDGTRGIVDGHLISLMSEASYLINIARGPLVVEEALVTALKSGPLAGAGLDVFDQEPLPIDSELRRLPNVALTPHLAGQSPRYQERVLLVFVENFRRWIQGEALINVVDKRSGF